MSRYKLNAKWTNDCSGKKNYDGSILVISTRYWPAAGGYMVTNVQPGQGVKFEGNEERPEIKPSACCSLCLVAADADYEPGQYSAIAVKEFEGETFEAVATEVESWAQAVMDRAVKALRTEFVVPKQPTEILP